MARFSKRINWTIVPNSIAQELEKRRRAGKSVLDLTESNPTRCAFRYLKPEILKALTHPKNLIYEPDPRGLFEAREAICQYYAGHGVKVTPGQIFLTASTSEAYNFVFRLMTDPGDQVLIPRPSYPLFEYLLSLNDLKRNHYSLIYAERWAIDIASLQAAASSQTRGIVLVNPNNPTGNFVGEAEKEEINSFCTAKGLFIISDEVFFDFAFVPKKESSFAGNDKVLSFTLSGISKILGLPQMKLSWIVVSGPPDLRQRAIERLEIIADTFLSVNTPSQRALPAWLRGQKTIRKEVLGRLLPNKKYLEEKFQKNEKVRVLKAEGGWYAVLQIHSDLSDEELALRLLKNQGVFVHPGYFFDFEEGNFLVLSLLPPPEIFRKGVEGISIF